MGMFDGYSYKSLRSLSGKLKVGDKEYDIPKPTKKDHEFIKKWQEDIERWSYERQSFVLRSCSANNMLRLYWALSAKKKRSEPLFEESEVFGGIVEYLKEVNADMDAALNFVELFAHVAPDRFGDESCAGYYKPWILGFDSRIDDLIFETTKVFSDSFYRRVAEVGSIALYDRFLDEGADKTLHRNEMGRWAAEGGCAELFIRLVQETPDIIKDERVIERAISKNTPEILALINEMHPDKDALFERYCLHGETEQISNFYKAYKPDASKLSKNAVKRPFENKDAELLIALKQIGAPIAEGLKAEFADESEDFAKALSVCFNQSSPNERGGDDWALNNEHSVVRTIQGAGIETRILYDFERNIRTETYIFLDKNTASAPVVTPFANIVNMSELVSAHQKLIGLGGAGYLATSDRNVVHGDDKAGSQPLRKVLK